MKSVINKYLKIIYWKIKQTNTIKQNYILTNKKHVFLQSDQKSFYGITDKQVNIYLRKIGFTDIIDGYACEKGDNIVLKAGYFRMMVSALTEKEQLISQPSSLEEKHWTELNTMRQKQNKTIFIFASREHVHPSLLKKIGRNNMVPQT